ncbi:hypothetical protein ABTX81_22795 [Kitasatospora sp. NPDC097605]|uniref:hypothetical protein n=1 Tax=Kitasatospora sp. NPDC097605 TaxID=3157226 RepID=UPI0033247DDE
MTTIGDTDGTKGRLAYDVVTVPAPLNCSVKGTKRYGTVSVKVFRAAGEALTCDSLAFTFPEGDAETDLLPEVHHGDIGTGCPYGTWNLEQINDSGRFVATPQPGYGTVEAGAASLEFTFSELEINSAPGTASLTIEETTGPVGAATTGTTWPAPLPKGPAGFVFADFRPVRSVVRAGTCPTLSWRAALPAGCKAFLLWDDRQVEVTTVTSYSRAAITQDTVFQLRACTTGDIDKPLMVLDTTVTVSNPQLHVRTLEATGPVHLLRPSPSAGPLEPLQTEMYADQPVRRFYRAETDGLLTGTIRTLSDGATAELGVHVVPKGGTDQSGHFSRISCQGPGEPDRRRPAETLDVLVPADSKVTVSWNLVDGKRRKGADGSMPDTITVTLRWQPWGRAALNSEESSPT